MTVKLPYFIAEGDTSNHNKIRINFETLESAFNQPLDIQSFADTSAPNSSLYFSTTQSKLVWKDSSGTVHDLY